jgi:copper(I)-binding protein
MNRLLAPRTFARRVLLLGSLALASAIVVYMAMAAVYEAGALRISQPWSRATSAGMPMGVAYLTITNQGKKADALIAASTPAAARVEIHHTTLVDGMARMRPLAEIPIPAGETVKIEPGGMHLMLVDLKAPLAAGKPVPLTLEFRVAGRVTLDLAVEAAQPPL